MEENKKNEQGLAEEERLSGIHREFQDFCKKHKVESAMCFFLNQSESDCMHYQTNFESLCVFSQIITYEAQDYLKKSKRMII